MRFLRAVVVKVLLPVLAVVGIISFFVFAGLSKEILPVAKSENSELMALSDLNKDISDVYIFMEICDAWDNKQAMFEDNAKSLYIRYFLALQSQFPEASSSILGAQTQQYGRNKAFFTRLSSLVSEPYDCARTHDIEEMATYERLGGMSKSQFEDFLSRF